MLSATRTIVLGLATYVPGLHAALRRGTGGTNSARYCYSVWLRHLTYLHEVGAGVPAAVAELGPGDSLGIGLAALLSGAETYTALDVVPHARNDRNLAVFDELVELFRARTPIPGGAEFSSVKPAVESLAFPDHVISRDMLEWATAAERVARLRRAVEEIGRQDADIRYVAPWMSQAALADNTLDYIFSQAVLEHVEQLDATYAAMARSIRPGGLMTHQIDFRSHGTSETWNGHLGYSDGVWKLMRGRLPYLLNRKVYSDHRALLAKHGFSIEAEAVVRSGHGLAREQLAKRFGYASDDDLSVSGAFVVARRVAGERRAR